MEEIKFRWQPVGKIFKQELTLGNKEFDAEFIYLQLRKILELIAFSSIISNKEVYSKTYEKFKQHWNAGRIFKDIEKVNPDFYPVALEIEYILAGNETIGNFKIKENYLSKDEFLGIYNECGNFLHATNPFTERRDIREVYNKIKGWSQNVFDLLNIHQVRLLDSDKCFIVHMRSPVNGKVSMREFNRISTK